MFTRSLVANAIVFTSEARTRALTSTSRAPWWSATGAGAARVVAAFARGARDVDLWRAFGDHEHGGSSSCSFALCDENTRDDREEGQKEQGDGASASDGWRATRFATLRGTISSVIANAKTATVKRSGFAGARTKALTKTIVVRDPVIDLDAFEALSYRVRGCGRTYVASVRTDNWMTGDTSEDVWQAAFTPPKDKWVDVVIPLEAFTQTYRGRAVADHARMAASRVVTLGIAVAGSTAMDAKERAKMDGAFALDLHSIVGLRMTPDEIERNAASLRKEAGDETRTPCGGFARLAFDAEPSTLL